MKIESLIKNFLKGIVDEERTVWDNPEWLPKKGEKGVPCLDELNRGRFI